MNTASTGRGQRPANPADRAKGGGAQPAAPELALPHERDQMAGQAGTAPRQKMHQARRDLEAGQVDTDLHGTPGLDAERLKDLVTPVKPPPQEDKPEPVQVPGREGVSPEPVRDPPPPATSPAAPPAFTSGRAGRKA